MTSYPGGKASSYQKIINLIPPHTVYIEPFLGGGAVLFNKEPAAVSYAIERDRDVLERRACEAFDVFGPSHSIEFVCGNAFDWLARYWWSGQEFVYLDPPYLMATRRSKRRMYAHELSFADHSRLLDIIAGLSCKVMISGYWSELYAEKLRGWNVSTFQAQTRGGRPATEYLWFNYAPPKVLHDYSYVGDDYRERERVRRRARRWVARLQKMSALERGAILSAISEAGLLTEIRSHDG